MRVAAARARQHARYDGCGWRLNGQVPGPVLRERWPLPDGARRTLDEALYAGRLSSRGAVRVHRLALTVADLASVASGTEVEPGGRGGRHGAEVAHRRAVAAWPPTTGGRG